MRNMQLTPNFWLQEFLRSDKAVELANDNLPTAEHLRNIYRSAIGMEWARVILGGRPVRITSGYRNPVVNAAVGGVSNSDHATGLAVDFTVDGLRPFEAAYNLSVSPLIFDQLIYEKSRGIVHVSFADRFRGQVLTQPGGPGTPVFPGINS